MLVKYKTILAGELKTLWHEFKNGVYKYEIDDYDYCCEEIEKLLGDVYSKEIKEDINHNIIFCIEYSDNYYCSLKIRYCPFCGKKIRYQEIKKVTLKKVEKIIEKKSIDYIEEEIK